MSAPLEMKPKKPVEKDAAAVEAEDEKMALESRSLFFFAPIRRQDGDSRIRSFMVALVRKKWFDRLILFAILANCSILAMQTPIKGPSVKCDTSLMFQGDLLHGVDGHEKGICSPGGPLAPGVTMVSPSRLQRQSRVRA